MTATVSDDSGTSQMIVPYNEFSLTFGQFIDEAIKKHGKYLWVYHPIHGNCQRFVQGLLASNGLNSSKINAFVLQPVESLIPEFLGNIGATVTNFANAVDKFRNG